MGSFHRVNFSARFLVVAIIDMGSLMADNQICWTASVVVAETAGFLFVVAFTRDCVLPVVAH